MRLIDADAFNDWILSRFAEPQNALILTLQGFIAEQPTAYDIGKVVAELEEAKHEICLSDDVCEWKYNNSEYYWESSCEHLHIFMSDGPEENEYKFCPYCGKKIKVVE